jgi:hypothetical protein
MNLVIYSKFYRYKSADCQLEIADCLRRKLKLADTSIVVLLKKLDASPLHQASMPVKVVHSDERVTYAEWLQWVKRQGSFIGLLLNADIHVVEGLKRLVAIFETSKTFQPLKRYTLGQAGFNLNDFPRWTQAVWGVRSDAVLTESLLYASSLPQDLAGYVKRMDTAASNVHLQVSNTCARDKGNGGLNGSMSYTNPRLAPGEDAELEFRLWTHSPQWLAGKRMNNQVIEQGVHQLRHGEAGMRQLFLHLQQLTWLRRESASYRIIEPVFWLGSVCEWVNVLPKRTALIIGITSQECSYHAKPILEKGYAVNGSIDRANTFNITRIDHLSQDQHEWGQWLKLHYGNLAHNRNLTRIFHQVELHEIYNFGTCSHMAVSFMAPEYNDNSYALGTILNLEVDSIMGLTQKISVHQANARELYAHPQKFPQRDTTAIFFAKLLRHGQTGFINYHGELQRSIRNECLHKHSFHPRIPSARGNDPYLQDDPPPSPHQRQARRLPIDWQAGPEPYPGLCGDEVTDSAAVWAGGKWPDRRHGPPRTCTRPLLEIMANSSLTRDIHQNQPIYQRNTSRTASSIGSLRKCTDTIWHTRATGFISRPKKTWLRTVNLPIRTILCDRGPLLNKITMRSKTKERERI